MKAHFVVLLVCLAHGLCDITYPLEKLELNNGLDRGEWGPTDLCVEHSWATTFEVKYESLGHTDETGMNAVRLVCQDASGVLTGEITSKEGGYGVWQGLRNCPAGTYMVGMRGDVLPDQGPFADDRGLTNLEMQCSDGTILSGRMIYSKDGEKREQNLEDVQRTIKIEEEHVAVKQWSIWAVCSTGKRICGIETQVETGSIGDDAGLANLTMYCCDVV